MGEPLEKARRRPFAAAIEIPDDHGKRCPRWGSVLWPQKLDEQPSIVPVDCQAHPRRAFRPSAHGLGDDADQLLVVERLHFYGEGGAFLGEHELHRWLKKRWGHPLGEPRHLDWRGRDAQHEGIRAGGGRGGAGQRSCLGLSGQRDDCGRRAEGKGQKKALQGSSPGERGSGRFYSRTMPEPAIPANPSPKDDGRSRPLAAVAGGGL
jgi:hypothetical protein